MNKSDAKFRKNCQFYYNKVRKLLAKGDIQEAERIIKQMNVSLAQWEEIYKSSRFKTNLLKNLCADLTLNEKRASYKLERRKTHKNELEQKKSNDDKSE